MTSWVVAGLVAAAVAGWTIGRLSALDQTVNLRLFIADLKALQDHQPCRAAIHRLSAALLEMEAEDSEALVAEAEQYLRERGES